MKKNIFAYISVHILLIILIGLIEILILNFYFRISLIAFIVLGLALFNIIFLYNIFKRQKVKLKEFENKISIQEELIQKQKEKLDEYYTMANPLLESFGSFSNYNENILTLTDLLNKLQTNFSHLSSILANPLQEKKLILTAKDDFQKNTNLISADIQKAFAISDNLSASAKNAFEISEKVQKEVNIITQALKDSLTSSSQLLQQSMQISGILTLLSELSAKINILSINASIVSARAGIAGNPFKVVAKEIRKLAGETDKSLQIIAQDIANIQSLIQQVVEKIKLSCEQTSSETKSLLEVVGALQGITLGVEVFRAVSKSASETSKLNQAEFERLLNDIGEINQKLTLLNEMSNVWTENQSLVANALEITSSLKNVSALTKLQEGGKP